jgi:hypothetical protein
MKNNLRTSDIYFYILIVILTGLCMAIGSRPCAADDFSKISSKSLGRLGNFQAALYLDCVMTGTAGALPAITNANQLNTPSYSSRLDSVAMAQFKSLTALHGLTPVQLGCLTHETLRDYAHQTFPKGQKTLEALTRFLTKSPASCLTIASGFTPANGQKIITTCHLP